MVGILNCAIITNEGNYTLTSLTLEEAKEILVNKKIISAVGHKSTAQILTQLLGVEVKENRIEFSQEIGQICVVFKLNARIPEGKILTKEEIETVGYSFKKLVRNS